MTSSLLSFNEIEEVTNYIENRNEDEIYNFISSKGNILRFLHIIRETIYNQTNTISFKLKNNKFQGDIVFDKFQFLNNLPKDNTFQYKDGNLLYTIGFPTICSRVPADNYFTCIKSINNTKFELDNLNELKIILNKLPVKMYNNLFLFIEKEIVSHLNKIKIFDTKRDIDNIFTFNNESIIKVLLLACRYGLKYIKQLKIVLMKESNFTLSDFDRITVEQSIQYYKILKDLTKHEQQ